MKYLKVFTDFSVSLEPLGDAECGRLFKAMLEYAKTGQEPDLRGNERFIWPTAKQSIDRDADTYLKKVDSVQKATEARKRNDNVSQRNDIAQDKDKDKDKDKIISSTPNGVSDNARTRRPTVEEVAAYCRERRNSVDAERFVDFYAAKGWKIGNAPMKDWRACVRTWEKREERGAVKPQKTEKNNQPDDLDRLERILSNLQNEKE